MNQSIFTVYDQKAHAYLPPFFLPEADMAIRTFSDCINNPEHQFGNHPEDYTLFSLGFFNDNTAKITVADKPILLHNGLELITSKRPNENEISNDTPIQPGTES